MLVNSQKACFAIFLIENVSEYDIESFVNSVVHTVQPLILGHLLVFRDIIVIDLDILRNNEASRSVILLTQPISTRPKLCQAGEIARLLVESEPS